MPNKLKHIFITIVSLVGLCALAILVFNRTPQRIIPDGNVIIAPANGEVIYIQTADSEDISFFKKDVENQLTLHNMQAPYTIVVIEMNVKNIHAQRMPISGTISYQEYISGQHKNALRAGAETLSRENEKNVIIIQNEDLSVGVIQVAGIMARRIRSFVDIGDTLEKGDIYGKITLGSQVVLVLPSDVTLLSQVGDVFIDGETVVAEYK
ncbi:MAG: phosphatidylserine decarboxylase [Candidatus Pacebacteria bacterium]|nr:phosphatidylserine decarboxylase [Candidatus Paceibacterota bacterium]